MRACPIIRSAAAALFLLGWAEAANAHRAAPLTPLSAVAPDIVQDMRYAGPDNLLGRPLAGYAAASCWLRPRATAALARAQARLKPLGFGLLVFDCYRPARAVRDLAVYADGAGPGSSPYHPRIARQDLIPQGYIARRSGHSTGLAVDLTLVHLTPGQAPIQQPACGGPRRKAEADMGTGFDCFDPLSWRDAKITQAQMRLRTLLREAMTAEGFAAYDREWWHFSLPPRDAAERQALDVSVR